MGKKRQSKAVRIPSEMVESAQRDAQTLGQALHEAGAAGPTATLGNTTMANGSVDGDTPVGITVDYEGPEDGDMPVGALQDFQLVALIKNILARGKAPFLYRFHNQVFLRVCG